MGKSNLDLDQWRRKIGRHQDQDKEAIITLLKFTPVQSFNYTKSSAGQMLALLVLVSIISANANQISSSMDASEESSLSETTTNEESSLLETTTEQLCSNLAPKYETASSDKFIYGANLNPLVDPKDVFFNAKRRDRSTCEPFSVKFHTEHYDYLHCVSERNGSYLKDQKQMERIYNQVQELLPSLPIAPIVLEDLRNSKLEIIILPEKVSCQNHYLKIGGYNSEQHVIFINRGVHCNANLRYFLTNEMLRAAIALTNAKRVLRLNQEKTFNHITMPQFNAENGGISRPHADWFTLAVKEFRYNIKQFSVLYKAMLEEKPMKDEDFRFVNGTASAIQEHYQPILHPLHLKPKQAITKENLRKYSDLLEDGSYRMDKEWFVDSPNDVRIFYRGQYIEYTYQFPDDPHSTVLAFLDDMKQIDKECRENFQNNHSGVDEKAAEYSVHWDSLPPEVKRLLGKQLCEYFSAFHEVPTYCNP